MHPTLGQLRDFSHGRLEDEGGQMIQDHLRDCPSCEAQLARIERDADSLLDCLRQMPAEQQPPESALERGLAGIKCLVRKPDAVSAVSQRPPARSVRDYQILEMLGSGGMGSVYRALHQRLGRVVALKVLSAERALDQRARERFDREMLAIGKLSHTHIVTALDAGDDDGVRYLVMELIDGADLGAIVSRQGRLPIADACEIVRQAALGLHYAHQQGIIHRDLKPSNLMLARTATGRVVVKILDLGLAMLNDVQAAGTQSLTSTGQLMGTLEYLSPEQASDAHAVDVRSDVYSLGATLFKLLGGLAPFEGVHPDSTIKKLLAIAQSDPTPLASLRPDCPEKLRGIVNLMLHKQPGRRPSPARLTRLLAPFCEGHSLKELLDVYEGHAGEPPATGEARDRPSPPTADKARETTAATLPPAARSRPQRDVPTSTGLPPAFARVADKLPTVARRSREKRGKSSGFGAITAFITLGLMLAAFASGTIYWLWTNEGLVQVQIHDPDLAVELRESGLVVSDAASNRSWIIRISGASDTGTETLPPGEYEVAAPRGAELTITDNSGVTIHGTEFELRRQEEVRIAISAVAQQPAEQVAAQDVAVVPPQDADPEPVVAVAEDNGDVPIAAVPEESVDEVLAADPPPDGEPLAAVQILELGELDLDDAVFAGTWEVRDDELVAPGDALPVLPRITLPFDVPDEYELRMSVFKDGAEGVRLGLVVGGRQVLLAIDSFYLLGGRCGLQQVDGLNTLDNPDTLVGMQLQPEGRENRVVCRVTRGDQPGEYHIDLLINDESILQWTGLATRLSNHPAWAVPDEESLFLGGTLTPIRVSHIELQTLKHDPDADSN